jgi:hypothetical protein
VARLKKKKGLSPVVLPRWLQQANEILARRHPGESLISRREEDEMFASHRATGRVQYGKEWNYLVTPCDMRAAVDMLPLLIRSGYRAGVLYDSGREREAAKAALEAVLIFLQSVRTFELAGGDAPLRALLRALEGLDRGAVEPMLRSKTLAGSRMSLNLMVVRGHAAAIAELTRRSGHRLPDACELVAGRLHRAGYRLFADSKRAITAETVQNWRRQALESELTDPIRDVFDRVCREFAGFGFIEFKSPERGIDDLIGILQSYVHPGV